MNKKQKVFVGFFFVIGILTFISGIHELVHYLISKHYKAEVEEMCFLGIGFDNKKWYEQANGWVAVTYNNNTDTKGVDYWNNIWDFNFTKG